MRPEVLADLLAPKLPENPLVITSCGQDGYSLLGLGDHSVWSTLPERFANLGYDVYLDKDMKVSNPEIYELVWALNPFVKGLSERKPNAGYVRQGLSYEIANRLQGPRGIEAVERAHGLPPPYSMAPKYYYTPKPHSLSLTDTVLVDFSAVSSEVDRDRVAEAMRMMAGKFRMPPFLQVLHGSWVVANQNRYLENAYACTSIFEYVDMIAACRAWIGGEAGGQSLASAVRGEHDVYEDGIRPEICVTSTRQTYNSRMYAFRTSDYRCTANDGRPDYWDPLEVKIMQYGNQCRVREIAMAEKRG